MEMRVRDFETVISWGIWEVNAPFELTIGLRKLVSFWCYMSTIVLQIDCILMSDSNNWSSLVVILTADCIHINLSCVHLSIVYNS